MLTPGPTSYTALPGWPYIPAQPYLPAAPMPSTQAGPAPTLSPVPIPYPYPAFLLPRSPIAPVNPLPVNASSTPTQSNVSAPRDIEEVRASHILVKTQAEAAQWRQKILSGQISFEEAAKQVSTCPSGKKGGDLGFFDREQMVEAFSKAAFSLPKGQLSEPVETPFGWHLIKVVDQKLANPNAAQIASER